MGDLLLLLVPVVGIWIPVFGVSYALTSRWLAAGSLVGLACAFAAIPPLYRRTGSVQRATRVMLGGLTLTGACIAVDTGGHGAPVMAWFTVFPLVATLLLGLREGLLWLILSTAVSLGLGAVEFGWAPIQNPFSIVVTKWIDLLSACGVSVTMLLVAWGFEGTRLRMNARTEEAREDAVRERELARSAHRNVRSILDTVDQALLFVDSDGRLTGDRSAVAGELFGELEPGTPVWRLFAEHAPVTGGWLEAIWPTCADELAPIEAVASQMPLRTRLRDKDYEIQLHRLGRGGAFSGLVLGLVDLSAQVEAEAAQCAQRELQRLAIRVVRDPGSVRQFLEETNDLLRDLEGHAIEPEAALRRVHTLKGTASLIGLTRLGEACDALETQLTQGRRVAEVAAPLLAVWRDIEAWIRSLLVNDRGELDIGRDHLEALLEELRQGASRERLTTVLQSWLDDPVARRFERLAQQARQLAHRLGKGTIDVECDDGGVRAGTHYDPLWGTLGHLVRNAVDHGLENPVERVRQGKRRRGRLRFEARRREDGGLSLSVSDDGRGVDFDRLRERAQSRGIEAAHASAISLLFTDGLSCKSGLTQTSGRGVGTNAVLEVVERLGGALDVETAIGEGTTFRIELPPEPRLTDEPSAEPPRPPL